MAQSFTAQIDAWVRKTEARMDAVVKGSTDDVISLASQTATGISRGGTLKEGYVPRDTGFLAASLVSTLHGSTSLTQGGGDYSLVVGSMQAGDVAQFEWTAAYAKRLHYGFVGTDSNGRTYNQPGWHWVDKAVMNWTRIVDANVRAAKAAVNG